MTMMMKVIVIVLLLILFQSHYNSNSHSHSHSLSHTLSLAAAATSPTSRPRPDVDEVEAFARWLVGEGEWGVLTTLNLTDPFGNVISFSDADTGVPYFYLSTLDPTARFASRSATRGCFTLSEREIYACRGYDPQSPNCGKITLTGAVQSVPETSAEGAMAEAALFADHPQFRGFPKQNGTFSVFKLAIQSIFLVNKAAPSRNISVEDYLSFMFDN